MRLAKAHGLRSRARELSINAEPALRRILDYRIDGIMTDCPHVLRRVLEGKG